MAKQGKRQKEMFTPVTDAAPAPEPSGEQRWTVRLPGNPERVIAAANQAAAVAAYRREMGIVESEHEFVVEEAADG